MRSSKLIFIIILLGLLGGFEASAAFEPITPNGMYPDGYVIGDLVRLAQDPAVYYLSAGGKRYSFPNQKTFLTWYSAGQLPKIITASDLALIPMAASVTYRPGVKMVKLQTGPTVYTVSHGGVLHAVPDQQTAAALYGSNWNQLIDDINDAFWFSYSIGAPLAQAADYSPAAESSANPTINKDHDLEITSAYKNFTINTSAGPFSVKVTELNRKNFKMITDTGTLADCSGGCAAKSLMDYLNENGGTAGIHGTYFCPPDYAGCAGQEYSFLPPVYNSAADLMINSYKLIFHDGPLMAADTAGKLYYFHRAKDFGSSVGDFENKYKVTLGAEIANYPSLIENGQLVVSGETMDDKQRTLKGARGAIGYNDQYIILAIGSAATVPDMAFVMQALGADNAMNLDGGGSVAMIYNNAYVAGPGRLLPNAIIFSNK